MYVCKHINTLKRHKDISVLTLENIWNDVCQTANSSYHSREGLEWHAGPGRRQGGVFPRETSTMR